jgi:AcrR family transcriptional regulator
MTSKSKTVARSQAPDAPSGPRAQESLTPKGHRTRAALVQAGRQVFEEQGFLNARIGDIAKAAGVAHGGFYHYFDSKEAVFRDVAMQVVGEIFDASRTPPGEAEDPFAAIEAANRRFILAWERNAPILAVLDQVATFNDEFRDLWRSIRRLFVERAERGLTSLQAEGRADPALDAHVAASALGGMVENFARSWLLHGEAFDREVAIITLTRLWAQAIGLTDAPER